MNALLEVRALNFAYTDRPVLRDITFRLDAGEIIALIGPNGSGKSTLLRTLPGVLHARGQITWFTKTLHEWRRRELARRVAYLPQSPLHEPGQRVIDVLRLGRTPYLNVFGIESARDQQVVLDVARQLQLEDILARSMEEISGGQRQRVFVARALVQEPQAILLDEPSTFLDLRHQVELMHLLRRLTKERELAVLMASHDLNLAAASADRLILLDNGAIAAHGAPADVLDPKLLARIYGVEMVRIEQPERAPVILPIIAGTKNLS